MKKVPTIVLSVSYKGVKFIDATNKVCSRILFTQPFIYFPNNYKTFHIPWKL